jgi:hypothetical protein
MTIQSGTCSAPSRISGPAIAGSRLRLSVSIQSSTGSVTNTFSCGCNCFHPIGTIA